MTGERLYERFTKAARAHDGASYERRDSVLPHSEQPPVAWPFLGARDKRVWNTLASTLRADR